MLLILLSACAGSADDVATDATDDTGVDTAGAGPATLTRVQSEIFELSCAFSSCHGGAYGSGGLDLTAGAAHAELVGVESSVSAGSILVVAGDSAASYLVTKCIPGATFVGVLMPEGNPNGLDSERLELLKAWIDAGANDD